MLQLSWYGVTGVRRDRAGESRVLKMVDPIRFSLTVYGSTYGSPFPNFPITAYLSPALACPLSEFVVFPFTFSTLFDPHPTDSHTPCSSLSIKSCTPADGRKRMGLNFAVCG